jgi:hypothetical protein
MPASAPPAPRRSGVAALALAALVGAAGCSPADPRVLDPTAAVTVAAASGPLALVQGEGGTVTLALERVDTDAPVTLAVDGRRRASRWRSRRARSPARRARRRSP